MTTKPETRKTQAAAIDPVFAAIAEHKAKAKESDRLEDSFRTARDKAEKKYGKWTLAPKAGEWPGEAIVSPFYDRWCHAGNAEWMAALRMARTKPTTLAGTAAMITHARREIDAASERWREQAWVTTALKTAASALARMGREAA